MYHADFNILGTERNSSMGIGPIPITRITLYADQEGVHDKPLFKRIILKLDAFYLELANKSKVKSKKGKKGKKR